jgi:alpha-galactosidase
MRVSCDVGPNWSPQLEIAGPDGTPAEAWYPSGSVALRSGAARIFAHGIWWVNDPDTILARPAMQSRHRWAEYVGSFRGLSFSGDSVASLDDEGEEITRRLLRTAQPSPLPDDELVMVDRLGRDVPPPC